jgi:peptide/nickel transport system ATP-binding protein
VIADEPTASLDVTTAAGITRLLRQAADSGTAIVIVSHDRNRLAVLADRILLIRDGHAHAELPVPASSAMGGEP